MPTATTISLIIRTQSTRIRLLWFSFFVCPVPRGCHASQPGFYRFLTPAMLEAAPYAPLFYHPSREYLEAAAC